MVLFAIAATSPAQRVPWLQTKKKIHSENMTPEIH